MLEVDALMNARDGLIDAALADCSTMLRIADHAKADPVIIGQLVAYAIEGIAVQTLKEALSAGDPSPAAARQLMDQLAAIDLVAPSIKSLKGEISLFGLVVFDMARRPGRVHLSEILGMTEGTGEPWSTRALNLYGTLGRPLLNLDEATYLRLMKLEFDAYTLPWPASDSALKVFQKKIDALSTYRGLMTKMIIPVFARTLWSREKTAANLGDARIALALIIYKSQHGAYPDTLDQLTQAGFTLPLDPFGGKPFKYRREGAGFLVYSLGSDMEDQHGLPPLWDSAPRNLSDKDRKYREDHYDLPFRRTR